MNHLLRSLAPISDAGWELLDGEAKEHLTPALAARKLVDFAGPHGWQYSATNLGRTASLAARAKASPGSSGACSPCRASGRTSSWRGPSCATPTAVPLDADLGPLDDAAREIAIAENVAVFHGWPGAITGIAKASPHERLRLGDADSFPGQVAVAVEKLLASGIAGPYGLALGSEAYRAVTGAAEHGGFPLSEHLRKIVEGPLAYAPGVDGAVLVSMRGGDF